MDQNVQPASGIMDSDILPKIGKKMGNSQESEVIMIDEKKGNYARLCLNIHPFASIPHKIEIHMDWGIWKQKVERENHSQSNPAEVSNGKESQDPSEDNNEVKTDTR